MKGHSQSDEQKPFELQDIHVAAVISSGAIVLAFLSYWYVEIQAARAMLEMAYG